MSYRFLRLYSCRSEQHQSAIANGQCLRHEAPQQSTQKVNTKFSRQHTRTPLVRHQMCKKSNISATDVLSTCAHDLRSRLEGESSPRRPQQLPARPQIAFDKRRKQQPTNSRQAAKRPQEQVNTQTSRQTNHSTTAQPNPAREQRPQAPQRRGV